MAKTCPVCEGDGLRRTKLRYGQDGETCIVDDPCETCGGDGTVEEEKPLIKLGP